MRAGHACRSKQQRQATSTSRQGPNSSAVYTYNLDTVSRARSRGGPEGEVSSISRTPLRLSATGAAPLRGRPTPASSLLQKPVDERGAPRGTRGKEEGGTSPSVSSRLVSRDGLVSRQPSSVRIDTPATLTTPTSSTFYCEKQCTYPVPAAPRPPPFAPDALTSSARAFLSLAASSPLTLAAASCQRALSLVESSWATGRVRRRLLPGRATATPLFHPPGTPPFRPPLVRPPKHPHFTTLSSSTFDQAPRRPYLPRPSSTTPFYRDVPRDGQPRLDVESALYTHVHRHIHVYTYGYVYCVSYSGSMLVEPLPTFSTTISLSPPSLPLLVFLPTNARISSPHFSRVFPRYRADSLSLSSSLATLPETIAASSVPRPGWTMGSTDNRLLFVDRNVVDVSPSTFLRSVVFLELT